MRAAVAANPSARRDTIDRLLDDVADRRVWHDVERDDGAMRAAIVDAVVSNPSVGVWLFLDLVWLTRLPSVVALAMARSAGLTPVLWSALAGHPSARVRLTLLRSPAAPADAVEQIGLRAAPALDLAGDELTDADVIALARSPVALSATSLDLSRNLALTDEAFVALARSTALGGLTRLTLATTHLGPRGARALASSTSLGRIERLGLYETGIGDEGAAALAGSTAFPGLRRLDLSADLEYTRDAVGDEGAAALAGSTTLGQLRHLDLSGSFVTGVGVGALAQSRAFPRLEELLLTGLRLGEAGVRALAASPMLATLRRLELRDCYEAPALGALSEVAARYPGLTLVI